jgi:hypothetical protein
MVKLFFRIAFIGLGLFVTYSFGKDALLPIYYRVTGTVVEGRISGFLAGRVGPSVQPEPDGIRNGKRRARRPAFMYPTAPGGRDSLEGRSSTGAFFVFTNYELNERVTVVYSSNDPKEAYILGFQMIIGAFLCVALGLYALKIGITGRA